MHRARGPTRRVPLASPIPVESAGRRKKWLSPFAPPVCAVCVLAWLPPGRTVTRIGRIDTALGLGLWGLTYKWSSSRFHRRATGVVASLRTGNSGVKITSADSANGDAFDVAHRSAARGERLPR